MSKYEHERDHDVHARAVALIADFCKKTDRILDVGCSTGHLLYLLKKTGFTHLSGIDPSPSCRALARKNFGLTIATANISSFKSHQRYDLIVLCSVLEHFREVSASMEKVDRMLARDGQVLIVVPDAGIFSKNFKEPFGEFSVEHINFFDEDSLRFLMRNYSCQKIYSYQGVLYSLWRRGGPLCAAIDAYIKESEKKLAGLDKRIADIKGSVIVWGAGSLTERLLATTTLRKKVIVFVDHSQALIGKKLNGIEVIQPKDLPGHGEPILVSSFRFKEEIVNDIRALKLKNRIITL
jgi:SAM-dependent methyltransferase